MHNNGRPLDSERYRSDSEARPSIQIYSSTLNNLDTFRIECGEACALWGFSDLHQGKIGIQFGETGSVLTFFVGPTTNFFLKFPPCRVIIVTNISCGNGSIFRMYTCADPEFYFWTG